MGLGTGGLRESGITRSEMINYLKKNLSISTFVKRGFYGEETVTVSLILDGDVISDDYIEIPKECSCSKHY